MNRALLIGNYGVGNVGDEALRTFFEQAFPDVAWTVVSAAPQGMHEVPRLPAGIRSLFQPWWKTFAAIHQADAVVFGGGSLFTDIESPFACFLWWMHAAAASLFGKPVLLAAQGIGPFKTKRGEWFARRAVSGARYISVRDLQSAARIKSWRKNTKVIQTFDPVFALFQDKKTTIEHKNRLVIIPRHNSGKMLLEQAQEVLQKQEFSDVTILLMHADHPAEQSYAKHLIEILGKGSIRRVDTIDELCREVASTSYVVSHRYHGALAALAQGVTMEIVSQGDDDKLASLKPDSGLPIGDTAALRQLVEDGIHSLDEMLRG